MKNDFFFNRKLNHCFNSLNSSIECKRMKTKIQFCFRILFRLCFLLRGSIRIYIIYFCGLFGLLFADGNEHEANTQKSFWPLSIIIFFLFHSMNEKGNRYLNFFREFHLHFATQTYPFPLGFINTFFLLMQIRHKKTFGFVEKIVIFISPVER